MTRRLALDQALPGFADEVASPARVAAGRAGLHAGVAWELFLELHHRRAAAADVVHVWQAGRPVIGYDPRTGAPRYGVAPPDFVGCIRGEGASWRPLCVEAKSRDRRLQRAELAPHQVEALAAIERAGGLALVAVELRAHGGRWAVRWRELEARWDRARGGGSVGPAELAGFELLDHPAGYLAAFAPGGLRA